MDTERHRLHSRAWAGSGRSHYGHCCGAGSHEPCTCGVQRRKHAAVHGGQHRDRRKAERSARRNFRRHHGQKPAGCIDPHEPDPENGERRGVCWVECRNVRGKRKVRCTDGWHRSTAASNAPGQDRADVGRRWRGHLGNNEELQGTAQRNQEGTDRLCK